MARHEDTQDVGWRLFCLWKMCEAKGQLLSFTGMLKVSIYSYIYLRNSGWLVEVERKHVGEHHPEVSSVNVQTLLGCLPAFRVFLQVD